MTDVREPASVVSISATSGAIGRQWTISSLGPDDIERGAVMYVFLTQSCTTAVLEES